MNEVKGSAELRGPKESRANPRRGSMIYLSHKKNWFE